MSFARILFLPVAITLLSAPEVRAEPTEIVVRVMAKDAKFVGTAMGGAQIVVRDADSGQILAQGLTAGGTGSTPKIMTTPHTARDVLSDGDAAKFSATIDIQRPRKITVSATGPMNPSEAAMTVSSTQCDVQDHDSVLADLLRLYAGHFLEHENQEVWAAEFRDKLKAKFRRSVINLAVCLERQRKWDQAAVLYSRALELDNLAEPLYRRLMICYRELGETAEALKTYRRCQELLSIVLCVRPSAETEAIRESCR